MGGGVNTIYKNSKMAFFDDFNPIFSKKNALILTYQFISQLRCKIILV